MGMLFTIYLYNKIHLHTLLFQNNYNQMEQLNNLSDRFNDICFTLSREQIVALNQSTNTENVNNVISRIS